MPATTACPVRRRSRGSPMMSGREKASTLEEKNQEEVKRLSRGKSFKEISNIFYQLEISSIKTTKDTPQMTTTPSNCTSSEANIFGFSGRGKGGRGRGTGREGGNPGALRAAWHSKLTNRPDWVNWRYIPLEFCAFCKNIWGTRVTTAKSHQTGKSRLGS